MSAESISREADFPAPARVVTATEEAFRRLAAGSFAALEELYDLEVHGLFALALWITGSREDAADAVQDVFTRLTTRRESLRAVRRPLRLAWAVALVTLIGVNVSLARGPAGLDYYSEIAEAFPSLIYAQMVEQDDLLRLPSQYRASLVPDLRSSLGTFLGTEALARLARLALDLALAGAKSGALPEELPAAPEAGPGPFTGIPPVYERSTGVSATLTIPGADGLWRGLRPGREGREHEAPLFRWRLASAAG